MSTYTYLVTLLAGVKVPSISNKQIIFGCDLYFQSSIVRVLYFFQRKFKRLFLFRKMSTAQRLIIRSFYTQKNNLGSPLITLDDGSKLYSFAQTGFNNVIQNDKSLESLLPPRVRKYPTRSKMTDSEIQEMKELRKKDADTNTVLKLAKRFNTYPGFVLKHTEISLERKKRLESQFEREFEGLSISKKKRLIDRIRRKALW